MIWIAVLAVAALGFLAAAIALRLPRQSYPLFGATLLFGLSGYALQGAPGLPSAPNSAAEGVDESGEFLVAARREFFDTGQLPSRFVITADAFTRRGQHADAANFLRNAVRENPGDAEAWLALASALVEHADGQLTPAALYAFQQAEQTSPSNPAPAYFLGLALLRAGRPGETAALWREILDQAPADAPWREGLAVRLERLESIMGLTPQAGVSGNPATTR